MLIGGVVWKEMTGRLSKMANLPIRLVEHPLLDSGEIFAADTDDGEKEFWPQWTDGKPKLLEEDVGLLARVPNPLSVAAVPGLSVLPPAAVARPDSLAGTREGGGRAPSPIGKR